MPPQQPQPHEIPSPQKMFVEVPLYKEYPFDDKTINKVRAIKCFTKTIDCYCPDCEQDAVLQTSNSKDYEPDYEVAADTNFLHEFKCTRDQSHRLLFIFKVKNSTLIKIGQYPSVADLAAVELRKYRTVLSENNYYAEFNRAVGLVSHAVGIGAFVYLRRIFERLIEEAHKLAMKEPAWDEKKFNSGRMDEKIAILKTHLPEFLVENRALYSILSKGIHELTEDECLEAFPVVKLGIELILDEKIDQLERRKKIESAKKAIISLGQKISKPAV